MNWKKILVFSLIAFLTFTVLCAEEQKPRVKILLDQKKVCPPNTDNSLTQGMAIYGNLMFSLRDFSSCVVIDLKKKKHVSTFDLGSYGKKNHANVAFFSGQKFEKDDMFPLMYVSQAVSTPVEEILRPEIAGKARLCFVERILTNAEGIPVGSELVGALDFQSKERNSHLWAADKEHPEYIYCYGNNWQEPNRVVVLKFKTPHFDKDHFLITLTDEDVVDKFYFDEVISAGERGPQTAILQGGTVIDGVIFLPTGAGHDPIPSEIFYVDMNQRDEQGKPFRYGYYNINDKVPFEMEDMDRWGNQIVCHCFKGLQYQPVVSFPIKDFKFKNRR